MISGVNPFMSRIGGKKLLKKIIVDDYFPPNYQNMIYVEPFIGGGSIFFYKEPSIKEVINDLDKTLISIYKGFKKYSGDKISSDINGYYDKEIFLKIKASTPKTEYAKFIKNFLLAKISFYGQSKSYGTKDKINSDYGDKYNERLKHTVILNKNYVNVIKKYDSNNTFFYLDPPYENSDNLYIHDSIDYNELLYILNNIKGLFLLSTNNSANIRKLFKHFRIRKVNTKYGKGTEGGQQHTKIELLISNY